jgi:hypothetical protein
LDNESSLIAISGAEGGGKGRGGAVAQIMYTHVSKCKNDTIKILKIEHIVSIFIQKILLILQL